MVPPANAAKSSRALSQGNYFIQRPNVIGNTSFHRGRDAQGLVNPAQIVVHKWGANICHPYWIADAHRDNGKRFVVRADELLTAFFELEATIRTATMRLISHST
jgi:hypothetical protein